MLRRTTLKLMATLTATSLLPFGAFAEMPKTVDKPVTISFYNYNLASAGAGSEATKELIANFEKKNPNIKVETVAVPSNEIINRVQADVVAGKQPDVAQLTFRDLIFIASDLGGNALEDMVSPAELKEHLTGMFPKGLELGKVDGKTYGLAYTFSTPILYYNADLFKAAGLDPNNPPKTLDEFVAAGQKIAKLDGAGNITVAGSTLDMGGQDHQWWREVLIRQFGGVPYKDGDTKVTYNDEAGLKALNFYTSLQTEKKIGKAGFMDEGQAAFRAGKAGMTIDGTFRLGSFKTIKDFEWGVTELPANAQGVRSNYASYFANGISAKTKGEELEASKKFLAYISSPAAMDIWLKTVGELPALRSAALTEANLKDPIYAPFLKGLEYAHTTLFKDELGQRQNAIDMVNRVYLEGQSTKDSLAQAAEAEQEMIDAAKP